MWLRAVRRWPEGPRTGRACHLTRGQPTQVGAVSNGLLDEPATRSTYPSAGRRTSRTARRTTDRPTARPPAPTPRAAAAPARAESTPTTRTDRLQYGTR